MSSYLTDMEYGKALDNLVVGCVDVAVIHDAQILLEKRQVEPIKGEWWIFGGRILVGEELKQAAQRSVERELGLRIDQELFLEVGAFNLRWPKRREPVTEHGCHQLLIAHMITLTGFEKDVLDVDIANRPAETTWFEIEKPQATLIQELHAIITGVKKVQANR